MSTHLAERPLEALDLLAERQYSAKQGRVADSLLVFQGLLLQRLFGMLGQGARNGRSRRNSLPQVGIAQQQERAGDAGCQQESSGPGNSHAVTPA